MKISPQTLAKVIGLGTGALVGGPLFAALGSTCGGFIGELLEDKEKGGWGVGDYLTSLCSDLFASKVQPFFEKEASRFNHDLRRAGGQALVQMLEWKREPGPLAAALLRSDGFTSMSEQRRELLQRIFKQWQDSIGAALKAAEKGNAGPLEALLPPGNDDDFAALADGALSAEKRTAEAWTRFYQQALQPVLDGRENKDDLKEFDLATLQARTITCLAAVFPPAFSQVVKSGDYQAAWMAYQKTLLTATQRAVQELGAQTGQRLEAIESRLDRLVNQEEARAEVDAALTQFLAQVQVRLDGTFENTVEIKQLVTACRQSLEAKIGRVQAGVEEVKKGVGQVQAGLDEVINELRERRPLTQYLGNLRLRFSNHHSLGISAVEDTSQKQGPDQIKDLFVAPACTSEWLRPEDLPTALAAGDHRRPVPLLPRLVKERRMVLLADPGMGKSTLIQWLAVTLAAPIPAAEVATLGRAIPLPFILRDLVPLLPPLVKDWTWQALVQAFLDHRHDKLQPGMAKPLADDEDTLRDVLSSPEAWFLIDGLDEVGDKHRREALRHVLWQGFTAHPQARFLITSRVVGYEEAVVDEEVIREGGGGAMLTDVGRQVIADMAIKNGLPAEEARAYAQSIEIHSGHRSVRVRAARLYLAPWQEEQQQDFARHWFLLRLGPSAGPVRAWEFVQAVQDHPGTCSIGRVPNLLLLMALLYRYRADLPHGRAKVYAAISHAYLENIAKVCRIDHRTQIAVPYTLPQKERLLAIIAMHMQVRRTGIDARDKTEILASRKDLEDWLGAEFGHKGDQENAEEMRKFINHIADTSGLLLPRGVLDGVDQFAFAHLSFQEYYAACWLELEFSRLVNLTTGGDDLLDVPLPVPPAPLELTQELLAQYAAQTVWREPLIFLAEKLAERPADTLTLRKWLFPIRQGAEPLPLDARRLLATLSIDPQVGFSLEQRQPLWKYLCKVHLQKGQMWFFSVMPFLLVESEYQPAIWKVLLEQFREMRGQGLDLSGCKGLSKLEGLQGLSGLQKLNLSGCTGLSKLEGLEGLSSLESLDLSFCDGLSNLKGLQGLSNLQELNLRSCWGLSSLEGLQGLNSLQDLYLRNCTGLSNLKGLQGLSGLQTLNLRGCTGLNNLEGLQGLSDLQTVNLSGCTGLSNLEGLQGLTGLPWLSLSGCTGLSNLAGLQGLSGLQELYLSDCTGLGNLEGLQGLSGLQELYLSDCTGLGNLEGLQRLSGLQKLNLHGCTGLWNLEGLQGLSGLQKLNLHGCTGLSTLNGLQGLGGLQALDLRGCSGVDDLERQVADLRKALPELEIRE